MSHNNNFGNPLQCGIDIQSQNYNQNCAVMTNPQITEKKVLWNNHLDNVVVWCLPGADVEVKLGVVVAQDVIHNCKNGQYWQISLRSK